jgi:hypothetical protein
LPQGPFRLGRSGESSLPAARLNPDFIAGFARRINR